MPVILLRGDARELPLPDGSVDLIACSPPYFGLRDYRDGNASLAGQIGAEETPREYVAALAECTREWVRVLKPGGSIFVNLGDKYAGGGQGGNVGGHLNGGQHLNRTPERARQVPQGSRAKSLLGLPWRYALSCMDDLGLILRAEIIWCLSGGARLYARTKTGDRPIMLRDLVRSHRPEDVQLWNGQQWTQALGWNRATDRSNAVELELRTGERIGCTPGHRWPTRRGVIRADEIRIGDVIETGRLPEPESPVVPAALDDEDIGWLVGLYLAEGSRSETTLQFAGHRKEEARHARLSRIAAAYHGSAAVYPNSENGVTCNIRGPVLRSIIDHYVGRGRTAKTKRLRKSTWQRSNQFLAAVVDGYLSGDGHYDAKNDRWRLGFGPNDEWAADLRTLAARLGAKLSLRRHDHMFAGRKYPGWRGEWRWTRSMYPTAKQDGEVVAIRASRAREFYDIGVADEPHLFALASGALTHNSKPNGLPESVTDRVRRSHEHLFHFTRLPRYYSAVDEIREPHQPQSIARTQRNRFAPDLSQIGIGSPNTLNPSDACNPLGKLPGSVWEIASQPLIVPPGLDVDHFAAWPMEIPRRLILGWSPPGICAACGEGRRPRVLREIGPDAQGRVGTYHGGDRAVLGHATERKMLDGLSLRTITGYACACPDVSAPTRPATVLDPFGGTGCTALVADTLGRTGISVDRSADYCRLARWRTTDPSERAKALQVPKPPVQVDGQESLFGEATA